MTTQYITRSGSIDLSHRVLNESKKCFNLHGHTYLYELTFEFSVSDDIGYPVDFKEIKRVAGEWLDRYMDHAHVSNPHDYLLIDVVKKLNNKLWLMSLNGEGNYCNPSVENMAREIFMALDKISSTWRSGLSLCEIKLWETPNCYTTCVRASISDKERENFMKVHALELDAFIFEMGRVEYDDRKISNPSTDTRCGNN